MASLQVQEVEFGEAKEYGLNEEIEYNNAQFGEMAKKMEQTEQVQKDLLRIATEQDELLRQAEEGYGAAADQIERNRDAVKDIRKSKNAGRRKKLIVVALLVMMVVVVALIVALFIAAKAGLFAAFA